MKRVTIVIPPVLRRWFSGQCQTNVTASTLREALESFVAEAGQVGSLLLDANGSLQRFVRVFVDGRPTRAPSDLDAPVSDGARVTILLALAGG